MNFRQFGLFVLSAYRFLSVIVMFSLADALLSFLYFDVSLFFVRLDFLSVSVSISEYVSVLFFISPHTILRLSTPSFQSHGNDSR